MTEKLRIQQVQEIVAVALAEADQMSGRVRAVPDTRTIRYYTTIGLIDRPTEMIGRTAYYGRKHVLQIVAIKRLQAAGLSLADVQKKLLGITNRQLKKIAEIPEGFWDHISSGDKKGQGMPKRRPVAAEPAGVQSNDVFAALPAKVSQDEKRTNFWAAPAVKSEVASTINSRAQLLAKIPLGNETSLQLPAEALRGISDEDLANLVSKISTELQRLGIHGQVSAKTDSENESST